MKNRFILLVIFTFLLSCSEKTIHSPVEQEGWKFLGLDGTRVEKLRLNDSFLYASTDDGIYRKNVKFSDTVWTPIGLQGKHAEALLVISGDTILASVDISGVDSDTISLFRTTNGGRSWQPFQNGLRAHVFELEKVLHQSDTLFAAPPLVKSVDGGLSWREVGVGGLIHFIRVDSCSPNIVWVGGEKVIFAPSLFKSTDTGENWQEIRPYLGGDNACHSIAIDPSNSDIAYVPMEGVVVKTTNGGNDWDIVFEEGLSYLFAIAINPYNPSLIYVAGARWDPAPLILYKSEDAGSSWTSINEDNPELRHGVSDLLLIDNKNIDKLYFATLEEGVYQYTNVIGR